MHTFTSQLKASQTKVLKNIKDINKRRLKFLELTAAFYNSTNRAEKINDTNHYKHKYCVYGSTDNSPGCAIGRWVSKDSEFNFNIIASVSYDDVFDDLPRWMQKMGRSFLQGVQVFHDTAENWDDKGLNELGQKMYKNIEDNINSGIYES